MTKVTSVADYPADTKYLLIVFKIAVKKSSRKSYEYINNKADDPPFGCTIHKL